MMTEEEGKGTPQQGSHQQPAAEQAQLDGDSGGGGRTTLEAGGDGPWSGWQPHSRPKDASSKLPGGAGFAQTSSAQGVSSGGRLPLTFKLNV